MVSALLIYGWLESSYYIAMAGAILFSVLYLIDLLSIIKLSKNYNKGKDNPQSASKKTYKFITDGLGMIIMFSGMFASMNEDKLYKIPGIIIWGGTIITYILSGFLIEAFAKIPLEMGYGGWKIRRFKRRTK